MKFAIVNLRTGALEATTDDRSRVDWPDGSVAFNPEPEVTQHNGYAIYTVVQDTTVPPAGKVLKSASVKFLNGKWRVVNEYVDASSVTTPLTKSELFAYSAEKRWQTEFGGMTLQGMPVYTDNESRIKISGARDKAKDDSKYTFDWKYGEGLFKKFNAEEIIYLSNTVFEFIQSCFTVESILAKKINDGTITKTSEIDSEYERLKAH